mmetsp:Transcript_888/g.1546  ORF Transcript_888/g.1546 Transcript_888/m.1546 type:complete len:175 (+) Transcript_888:1-525(+)
MEDIKDNVEQQPWWLISTTGEPSEGGRLHTRIQGRYITIFQYRGQLSAIDSICHHAGGPLTQGRLQDIEDLGLTVVSCPWHKFLVSIDKGVKVYKAIEVIGGKPTNVGWRTGKEVQRAHEVVARGGNIYVKLQAIDELEDPCTSDQDASSELCGKVFELHPEEPVLCGHSLEGV